MFNDLKDKFTSKTGKTLIATMLQRYGKLLELQIQSREKMISLELLLEGEEKPISIIIERYQIREIEGESTIVIEKVKASRPWLENLLQDHLVGKTLNIPKFVALAL